MNQRHKLKQSVSMRITKMYTNSIYLEDVLVIIASMLCPYLKLLELNILLCPCCVVSVSHAMFMLKL